MRLIVDSGECFSKIEYDAQTYTFELIGDKGNSIFFQSKLELDNEYDPSNFELFYLNNGVASESSIYKVYCGDVRVGWMFPIQALISSEHDYATDKFFLRYAFVATYRLLSGLDKECKELEENELFIDAFYDTNKQILVLDVENLSELGPDFSIDEYVVSLYEKGYSFVGTGRNGVDNKLIETNLRLKPLPVAWEKSPYIVTLFRNLIPKESDPLAKFHILYQCVEIMITIMFKNSFYNFVNTLNCDEDFLMERKEVLDKMLNEKSRVKELFSSNCSLSDFNRDRLNSICKTILDENKYKTSANDNLGENLYNVRCLIVHNMYVLNEKSLEDLKTLVSFFEDALIEMVMTFSISREDFAKKPVLVSD